MHLNRIVTLLFISSSLINSVTSIEPFTIGALAVAGITSYFFMDTDDTGKRRTTRIYDNIRNSKYLEFCSNTNIPYNIEGLKKDLQENLFGQHIVNGTLIPALRSHINHLQRSQKPLVMSFHGLPGTGKNYVADMIVKHFYLAGDNSKFVHKYNAQIDFPLETEVDFYRIQLKEDVISSVKACARSIFIFDEVEKMPSGIFESITSLLDHHSHINGVDFRKSIFIFLMNAGGKEIANALNDIMSNGKYREQTGLNDFEQIAETAAYNVKGGLKGASIITSSLIDHFLTFLPLERRHVEKCVYAEFKKLDIIPTDEQIREVVDNHVTYNGIFSRMGCKRLNKKIAVMVEKW